MMTRTEIIESTEKRKRFDENEYKVSLIATAILCVLRKARIGYLLLCDLCDKN
jgi:hypothetical protein